MLCCRKPSSERAGYWLQCTVFKMEIGHCSWRPVDISQCGIGLQTQRDRSEPRELRNQEARLGKRDQVIDHILNKETAKMVLSNGTRGRRRGVLETISDPKLRRATFFKRKKSQKKRLYELTTLCDVEAFMICFGPNGEVDTWPEDPRELRRVVDRYMGIGRSEREKRVMGVADFVHAQKKKLEGELKRVKKENEERSCGIFGWDSRVDGLGEESMKELLCSLENNIKFLNEKIETMKSGHGENTTDHMGTTTSEVKEVTCLVDHQVTPNHIFDDSQFYHLTEPQFPIFEEPPLMMYPLEQYNTQFANNSHLFINSSHIGEADGFEIWDPTMRSSLINSFTGAAYQAQPLEAIPPSLGLPPLTNPTTNYNLQNFDVNPGETTNKVKQFNILVPAIAPTMVIKEMMNGGTDYCFECIGSATMACAAYASYRKAWGKELNLDDYVTHENDRGEILVKCERWELLENQFETEVSAVCRKAGEALRIKEVVVAPPEPGEVRIKIICAALFHTDFMRWELDDQFAMFPRIFGHEDVGVRRLPIREEQLLLPDAFLEFSMDA
ncbi:hypothetical protein Sjap_017453 [Stephania japonica]|uniref:MADS-box domain-containing protein n=1 Tax=Stephania japonica TaxID=461633 RepID=A0AAP0I678_9MAGN